jgi:hypothetical protein
MVTESPLRSGGYAETPSRHAQGPRHPAVGRGQVLSRRQVGASLGIPFTTVADHLRRAGEAGLSRPLPDGLDDAALEAVLFAREPALGPTHARHS